MALSKGFDVSFWQANLPKISGAGFVIIRASYGDGSDGRFVDHVRTARARGLEVGAYHFGVKWTAPEVQVEAFLQSLRRVSPMPKVLVLDVESDGDRPRMTDAQARRFFEILKARVPTARTVLYMSSWEFRNLGQEADWPANWTREPAWDWELWQYRGAPIDLNYFNGTDAEMREFFAGVLPPKPKPDPRPVDDLPAEFEDPMLNLTPSETHRDLVLKPGAVMRHFPRSNAQRYSRVERETPLGYVASCYGKAVDWRVVNNGGKGVYVHKDDVSRVEVFTREVKE